jgi:enoyl-CoA hydratase/carnithine racemase
VCVCVFVLYHMQAKALGMVDQVVDKGQILEAAEKVMSQLVKVGQSSSMNSPVQVQSSPVQSRSCHSWSK